VAVRGTTPGGLTYRLARPLSAPLRTHYRSTAVAPTGGDRV